MIPDQARLDALFPIRSNMVFLNHAGVAPLSAPAADAMAVYIRQAQHQAYVDSDWYARAGEVKKLAARLMNAQGPDEIAFVANTSMGISLVAKGLAWAPGQEVVTVHGEYPANHYPWKDLERFGVKIVSVDPLPDGRIDVQDICDAITDRTRVVAISHVQFSSGYRIDLKPISDMVHQAGGYLFVDAIQSLGVLPVDVQAMGIDFLAADGHKWLLAPEGAGLFYAHADLIPLLHPNVVGWLNMVSAFDFDRYRFCFCGDARRFEPGSYNIPGILALGASLEMILEFTPQAIAQRVHQLTCRLTDRLNAKGYRVFSPRKTMAECSGIVSFLPPVALETPLPTIVGNLQQQKIILAIRHGRLRASPHFYNTLDQMDRLVDSLP